GVVAEEEPSSHWRRSEVERPARGQPRLTTGGPAGRVGAVAGGRVAVGNEGIGQPGLRRGGVFQVVVQETDRPVGGDVDLRYERLRVARRLVDPDHWAPGKAAIGGLG